jgi:DNA-binding NarL/FixJ family response regulator
LPHEHTLTNSAKAEDLRRALTAGAKGYLLKGAKPREVWETIREVYAGKSSLPHEIAAQLADSRAHAICWLCCSLSKLQHTARAGAIHRASGVWTFPRRQPLPQPIRVLF